MRSSSASAPAPKLVTSSLIGTGKQASEPKIKRDPKEASRLAVAARLAEAAHRPATESSLPVEKLTPPAAPPTTPPKDAPASPTGPATANLVSVPIELSLTVRAEPEKFAIGYSFFCAGLSSARALAVVLNSEKLIVSRALAKSDTVTVTFLYALLVAENLALRSSESPLVRALQHSLAQELYPQGIARNQVFCDFATRLSLSPLLAALADLPIYGSMPKEGPFIAATLTIQVSPEVEKDAPWKRLSRKWRPRTDQNRERTNA
jgi:hypothetical protein